MPFFGSEEHAKAAWKTIIRSYSSTIDVQSVSGEIKPMPLTGDRIEIVWLCLQGPRIQLPGISTADLVFPFDSVHKDSLRQCQDTKVSM